MLTSLTACAAVTLLLLCWSGGPLRRSPWPALIVTLGYGYALVHDAARNIRAPREWDYACFWLYGHIAAAHQNVYDPAVFSRFALPFMPNDEFRAAVLNVGFPYPPPTIALFLPLGFVDSLPLGLTLWYVVQFAALLGAAWLLARTLLPADGWRAALFVLALSVALPASLLNVSNAQTNFLVLLVVALALHGQATAAGAVWEMLAVWVKPYAAGLLLLDLLRQRWGRLVVAGVTAAVSIMVGALLLGPAALENYLRSNPAAREPSFAFVESVNESLLAIVLRLHASLPPHVSALHEPLYVVGALLFGGVTIAVCSRNSGSAQAAFAAMLLLGLIVYPGTLSSYGVILVVPLLVLWQQRHAFPGGTRSVAAIVAVAVLFQSNWLGRGFEGNVLIWVACCILVSSLSNAPRARSSVPANVAAAVPTTAGVAG